MTPQASPDRFTGFFPHINLLRGFAALSVLVYHVIELYPWTSFPITPWFLLWFRIGWMGVDLFFVISGFVIMLSACSIQENAADEFPRKTFMRRRAARIVPLYLFTGMIFVIFVRPEMFHEESFVWHVVTHLGFIHSWFPSTHGSINGPNWSVGVEFQFYLLMMVLMPVLHRIRPTWLVIGGVVIAVSSRALVFAYAEVHQWDVGHRFQYATQLVTMMDEFCLGMVIAKLIRLPRVRQFMAIEPFWKSKPFWVVVAVSIALFWVTFSIYWSYPDYWHDPFMVVFWRTLLGASMASIVAISVMIPAQFLSHNPLYRIGNYVGEISYGIYLWHLPVLLSLKTKNFADPKVFLMVTIACVGVLSIFSWHLFEKPIAARYKNPIDRGDRSCA